MSSNPSLSGSRSLSRTLSRALLTASASELSEAGVGGRAEAPALSERSDREPGYKHLPPDALPRAAPLDRPYERPLVSMVDMDTRLTRSMATLVPIHPPSDSPSALAHPPLRNDPAGGVLHPLPRGALKVNPARGVRILDRPPKVKSKVDRKLRARAASAASSSPHAAALHDLGADRESANSRLLASMRARDPLRALVKTSSLLDFRRGRPHLARDQARALSRRMRRRHRAVHGKQTDGESSDELSSSSVGSSSSSSSLSSSSSATEASASAAAAAESAGLTLHAAIVHNILQQLSKDQLAYVQQVFAAAPDQELSRLEFVATLEVALNASPHSGVNTLASEQLHDAVVAELCEVFNRIDIGSRGVVSSTEFLDYVLHSGESHQVIESLGITAYATTPELVMPEHDEQITRIRGFSALNHLVTCHKNGLASVWNPANGTLVRRLRGHESSVLDVDLVPPSDDVQVHRLVTSSVDRTIIMWDATSYSKLSQWRTDTPQTALAWAEPIRKLFSGGTDGLVKAFDLKTAVDEMEVYPKAHTNWITDLAYIAPIASLVSASLDGTVVVWDVERARKRVVFTGHSKAVHAVAFAEKSKLVVSGGVDRDLLVWNPFMDSVLQRMSGHDKPILSIIAIPHSHEVISADMAGKIRVWDIRRFQCLQTLGGRGSPHFVRPFECLTYSPKTASIITVGRRWLIYPSLGESVDDSAAKFPISTLIYNSAFDNILVVAGTEVTIWDVATARAIATYSHFSSCEIVLLRLSRNQRQVIVANALGVISVFNYSTGALVLSFQAFACELLSSEIYFGAGKPVESKYDPITPPDSLPETAVLSSAFALDNVCDLYHVGQDALLLTTTQGYILVYDISTPGAERVMYTLHSSNESQQHDVSASAYCPHVRMFACGGSGLAFHIWKMDTYSSYHTKRIERDITAACFAHNMDAFITADTGARIIVYSLGSFNALSTMQLGAELNINSLTYSAAAKVLVSTHQEAVDGPLHAMSWSLIEIARELWYAVEAAEDVRARRAARAASRASRALPELPGDSAGGPPPPATTTPAYAALVAADESDAHADLAPVVLSQAQAYLRGLDDEVARVTGVPNEADDEAESAAEARARHEAAVRARVQRLARGRGFGTGSRVEGGSSASQSSASKLNRARCLRVTDALPLHELHGRSTPDDYRRVVDERRRRKRASAIRFPRHVSGDRNQVLTNLNAFTMHVWPGSNEYVTAVAVSEPVPALLFGTQSGRVKAYSPYGEYYGELLLKVADPVWDFPLDKRELLPKLDEDAHEAVLVEKVAELTSPSRRLASPLRAVSAPPPRLGAGESDDEGQSDGDRGSADGSDATGFVTPAQRGGSQPPGGGATLDAQYASHKSMLDGDDDDAMAVVMALQRPSNRGRRKVEYMKEKERYMGALSPFYNELKRSSYQPQVVRPFFLPKSSTNVRQDAMIRGRESMRSTNFWRMRREAEAKQHVIEANPLWKEYMMAKKRRASSRNQVYVPTFDGRAKRLEADADKPWRTSKAQPTESDFGQEKRTELRKLAAADRKRAQAEAEAAIRSEEAGRKRAAVAKAAKAAKAAQALRKASGSAGRLARPLDAESRSQLTRQNTLKRLQRTLGGSLSSLNKRESPGMSSRRLQLSGSGGGQHSVRGKRREQRSQSQKASRRMSRRGAQFAALKNTP
ncbi:WD40 domain-containing protein [Thecamonas trahens ATCC 50062]|uniref:WD40 domain-containing protein n=1 Tax=Thecamonas trahens ATCC 50062 TaxID=461836 RepID=A0A0L0D1H6_THETB|nr:WD40 domain-containing protein [Thecamonas trahens ATCC 50062]KNC46214.1 WD40 domain-containing protein [Thecamonas trahens ATCC 50062]|eukprot:XP_013760511.1 WD40 domain-containing protein [Thecamonas trahens ATCC 50062]